MFKKYWMEIAIVICCIICFTSLLLYVTQFGQNGLSENTDNWGTFGEYIGGVLGTILAFFSVILIYATYKNQRENSLLQQFESTFFSLLLNQREILKSLKGNFGNITHPDKKVADEYISEVAYQIYKEFDGRGNRYFEKNRNKISPNFSEQKDENMIIINDIYKRVYRGKESELGHHFRHLYHIIKYVHESKINNKKKYVDIIQAQMSDDELYVTFYNGISEYGREKFLPLLETYSFFENVRDRGNIFEIHCTQFYPKTNFKYKIEESESDFDFEEVK